MSEQEYVDATNLAKARAARQIIGDMNLREDFKDNEHLATIKWLDKAIYHTGKRIDLK